ncbi:MAG: hypothetical protein H6819_09935 [Phycisphaerales bacterium]|nr:hypothetical protein [Phycisphaerales bacterium]MCB9857968.1 hypothetical protein [Phycisphaerales bacterium]MCB9864939.1 hypothetical protein [Phycisphaerales bacterium]
MIPKDRLLNIPRRFRLAHEFAFYLHDILAEVVVHGEISRIFVHEFTFRSTADAEEFNSIDGPEILNWLKSHSYADEAHEIILRNCIVAVLSDMCQYLCEALFNSEKGKLSVAHSLLRKPLRDNLFELEWMLAHPQDWTHKFFDHEIAQLDVTQLRPDERIQIIAEASRKAGSDIYIDAEFLNELRYDRTSAHGLNAIWDKSLHLITTIKHYKTEDQNLNFVFSDDESRFEQWSAIYLTLPLMLMHAVDVVEALLDLITKRSPFEANMNTLRRQAGFLLCSYYTFDGPPHEREKILGDASISLGIECPICNCATLKSRTDWLRLFRNSELRCPECYTILEIPDRPSYGYYVMGDEELEEYQQIPRKDMQ